MHSGANGDRLLTLSGGSGGEGFGIGPADAGDLDGDGHDDLAVGAWQYAGAAPAGGRTYLYSGADGRLLRVITGKLPGETFGFDATGIGEIRVGTTGLDALGVSLVGGGGVSNSAIDFAGVSVVVGLPGDAPVVLSRTPVPDSVVNRTVGVTVVGVRFDRPVTIDSVTIVGVNSGLVTSGSLLGNGTGIITLVVGGTLPDRDRYTVTFRGPGLVAQWEFVALVGDCDGNRTVDVFDLARMRAAIRSASFDSGCDIVEDNVINIFDLIPLRRALQAGATAP